MQFIFTCDDVAGGDDRARVEQFRAVARWLDEMSIPGTFFWVPRPAGERASDDSELWVPAVEDARARGHDFQLHGHHHDCFEFGVPQESVRRHAPELYQAYDANREAFVARWTVPRLRDKFEDAVVIYQRAFGVEPLVFRAACLGIGPNAYEAMYQVGLRYSSSRSVNPGSTGYVITGKPELYPCNPDYSGVPFLEPPGVLEMPCMEDLVIRGIAAGDFTMVLELFQRDLEHYLQVLGQWPFGIFASHYWAIGRDLPLITRLYETLFDWLSTRGVQQWTTFGAALQQLRSRQHPDAR